MYKSRAIPKFKESKIEFFSPTSLEYILKCGRQYLFYKTIKGRTNADLAMGKFTHNWLEKIRIKRHLNAKGQYKSAESCANSLRAIWLRFHAGKDDEINKIGRDIITWRNDGERYSTAERIRQIFLNHYGRIMEEPMPLVFQKHTKKGKLEYSTEFGFKFIVNKRGFVGKIDEVFPNLSIRDYKTGRRAYLEKSAKYKFQPTFYSFGYCVLCNKDKTFREAVNVSEEQAKKWAGNPEFICPELKFHYYMLEDEKKEDEKGKRVIVKKEPEIFTTRKDRDYLELIQILDLAHYKKSFMEETRVYPAERGYHCNYCMYTNECDEMTDEIPCRPIQLLLFGEKQKAEQTAETYKQLNFLF